MTIGKWYKLPATKSKVQVSDTAFKAATRTSWSAQ